MEEDDAQVVQVRGKDLPGAVNVLPAGLSEVLAKRESREIHFEQHQSSSSSTSFKAGQFSEQSCSSRSFASSSTSSSTLVKKTGSHVVHNGSSNQCLKAGQEIQQESLKSTLQSAITDIEQHLELDKNKENQKPPSGYHLHQADGETAANVGANGSTPNAFTAQTPEAVRRLRFPHEFKGRPQSLPADHGYEFVASEPLDLPDVASIRSKSKVETVDEEKRVITEHNDESGGDVHAVNGSISVHREETSCSTMEHTLIRTGSATLDKILAPSQDTDVNSLKRRNPRQMFTDSAFYSPKFHPSVAEQVEMAHKLSSSLYDDGNKLSKGQEMYMKRAKKSGVALEAEELAPHDRVPNLKLVMNPEGKLHDWTDLPEDELPELQMIALGGPSSDLAQHVVQNLQSCQGRGMTQQWPASSVEPRANGCSSSHVMSPHPRWPTGTKPPALPVRQSSKQVMCQYRSQ